MSAGAARARAGLARTWIVAVLLAAAAITTAHHSYRALPRPAPLEELAYYPSGRHLEWATLGHAETAADLAWLRAIQYYGEHRQTDNTFAHMAHVFDILTSLSPDFVAAYQFGGFALAQEGRDFAGAEKLMLKGIEANPRNADLAFALGFLYYVKPGGRALRQAAEYFELAARQPVPHPRAARFAAFARQHGGSLAVAYEMWASVYETSPNAYLKEAAVREMERIRAAMAAGRAEQAMRKLTTPRVLFNTP